jgi:hypothetical protein
MAFTPTFRHVNNILGVIMNQISQVYKQEKLEEPSQNVQAIDCSLDLSPSPRGQGQSRYTQELEEPDTTAGRQKQIAIQWQFGGTDRNDGS